MKPKTEQILGTLELLVDKLSVNLPGHEDGGYVYPFVWEEVTQGKFNIFNLCQANNWLNLTDTDAVIKSWQQLEYARHFNAFALTSEQIKAWENKINSLWQNIKTIDNLKSYTFNFGSYGTNPNIILGQIEDNVWVGIAPTIYVETNIPHEIIARYSQPQKNFASLYGEKAVEFDGKIKTIITKLGSIALNGDFGGGYYYSYTHKLVYSFGATQESALTNTLQKTGMLEISKFAGLYRDRQYLDDWYCDYNTNKIYQKYDRINQFMTQTFQEVIIYRLSNWIAEKIYLVGEINESDRAGIYLESYFVYNP
jgi:hypothetical protein